MEVSEPSAKYLRTSYKQTELGLLPTDWRIAELGQIAETSSGTTPPRSQYDRYFKGGVHAWVKTLDLNNAEILQTDESVTDRAVEETSLRLFPEGSVLVAMYGGLRQIGRTGLLRLPAAVNQAITAIRPNPAVVCPEFLLFYLNHRVGHWQSVASSSRKDPNITGADVRAFKLPLPAIGEQQRVANALADADALIDSLEQLLAKKRQIKQGAMQELLTGKRRLPGFEAAWTDGVLGDVVAELVAGVSVNSDPTESGAGVPSVVKTSALKGGVFDPSECKPIIQADLPRATTPLRQDTLLISRMNTPDLVGEVGYVDRAYDWLYLPDRVWMTRMRSPEGVCVRWLGYLLSSAPYKRLIGDTATGTSGSMKNIAKSGLLGLPLRFPEVDEQCAIAESLADMDAEIEVVDSRLTKARALKQAMAQALLTGRIRLVEPTA